MSGICWKVRNVLTCSQCIGLCKKIWKVVPSLLDLHASAAPNIGIPDRTLLRTRIVL